MDRKLLPTRPFSLKHRLLLISICYTRISEMYDAEPIVYCFKMSLLQDFYETTLEALRESKNDRLWFKTNTKLGKLYFDRGEYVKLQKVVKQLHQSCLVRYLPFSNAHVH